MEAKWLKIAVGTMIAGRKMKGKYSSARLGISDMDTSQKNRELSLLHGIKY